MCQMASEALLRSASSLASCSSKALLESSKTSEYSSSSFLPPSMAKGFRTHGRLVCRMASSEISVSCPAIMPILNHEQLFGTDACGAEQKLSSPDRWMEDCVCDIVRNINEAPFLHMLFDSKDSSSGLKSQRQRVEEISNLSIEDKWRAVKDSVKNASPDGVILVHQLDDEAVEGCCLRNGFSSGSVKGSIAEDRKRKKCGRTTNLWGVLVLGKTVAISACYILKTTSVASSLGTCTQFCLTKAKCFGPSWHDQVQSCWLLSAENSDYASR